MSQSQAQTIAGQSIIGMTEAPQGPTCIYRASNARKDITLTVEQQNFSQVTGHMMAKRRLAIAGHRGYCGRLGDQMLFVALSGGRVLNVTAPCTIAQRFAAVAVGRLST